MRAAHALVPLILQGGSAARCAPAVGDDDIRIEAGVTGSSVAVSDREGAGMVTEIKKLVSDRVAVGGRVEVAVMFGGKVGDPNVALDVAMAACGLVKGELYLADGPLRPFVGLGVGGYTIGSQVIDDANGSIRQDTGRYFGVAPQLGVDVGRLRLAATYNAILGASLELHQMISGVEHTSRASQSYLSLELSFRFAGGAGRTR